MSRRDVILLGIRGMSTETKPNAVRNIRIKRTGQRYLYAAQTKAFSLKLTNQSRAKLLLCNVSCYF